MTQDMIRDDLQHMQKNFDRLKEERAPDDKGEQPPGISCDNVLQYNERNSPGSGDRCEVPTS